MNPFFNKLRMLALVALAAFAVPTVASATCVSGPLCGNPSPSPSPFRPFDLEVYGMVSGFGAAQSLIGDHDGVEGSVFAGRDSFTKQDIETWLSSDLCPDDCKEGGFNTSQQVMEHVWSGGTATNTGAGGTAASISGVTMSEAMSDLMIRFRNTTDDDTD